MIDSYEEAIAYIEGVGMRGSILGLDRMKALCGILNNPENRLKFVHVAGTNGKGSTSCFIASILREAGYRVGMYYSPSMISIKDHYRINDELITDDEYTAYVARLAKANSVLMDKIGEEATQFELETALAFLYFAEKSCDIVVLEVGMGGADDATNVVGNKELCVFTSISLDHTAILGNTVGEIAAVKSGILTSDYPAVMLDSGQEVADVIRRKCTETGSSLCVVQPQKYIEEYGIGDRITVGMNGTFQLDNASLAVAAANELIKKGYKLSYDNICEGIRKAYWPFRFEKICDKPEIYVDGAHNPDAARRLHECIMDIRKQDDNGFGRIIYVLGMFKDKDCEEVISLTSGIASKIYTISVPNPQRAMGADELKKIADKYCDCVETCDDITEAVHKVTMETGAKVVAFGSLSFLSAFKDEVNRWKESTEF